MYRLGSLGDTVVIVPALRVVEAAFPHAERLLLTNMPTHAKAPAAFQILAGSDLVHGFLEYPWKTRSLSALAKLWWRIVRWQPDAVIYIMPLRSRRQALRDRWFFRLCGVRRIVGLPADRCGEYEYDAAAGMWESEAARMLRCVRSLGAVDVNDLANWDLRLTPAELARGREATEALAAGPFIACGPGTKMQSKDWGRENWRELLGRLNAALPGRGLLLVGAREDSETAEYAAAAWRGTVANACGRLTPRETAAAMQPAELFLGPDSGPMHLAAAYGVPCAIPFAALDFRGAWFPIGDRHRPIYHAVECAQCHLTECIEQKKKCLTSITVDEMFAAAMEAWKNGRRQPVEEPA